MCGDRRNIRIPAGTLGFWRGVMLFCFGAVFLVWPTGQAFAEQSPVAQHKLPSSQTNPSGVQRVAPLLVQSDVDCTFALDDQPKQALKAGEIKKISATLGEHLVTALSADGKDRWKTVVDLDKPLQKVVLIELVKVRAARQVAERQVLQLQQEIAAKGRQATEAKEATQARAEQQEEVKKQRQEIEDQIDGLSKEARKEEAAAQNDEARAQEGRALAGTSAAQGTNLGNLTALLGNLGSSNAVDSAAKHRAKARELQGHILDLNRKLERLSAGELTPVSASRNGNRSAVPIRGNTPSDIGITTENSQQTADPNAKRSALPGSEPNAALGTSGASNESTRESTLGGSAQGQEWPAVFKVAPNGWHLRWGKLSVSPGTLQWEGNGEDNFIVRCKQIEDIGKNAFFGHGARMFHMKVNGKNHNFIPYEEKPDVIVETIAAACDAGRTPI